MVAGYVTEVLGHTPNNFPAVNIGIVLFYQFLDISEIFRDGLLREYMLSSAQRCLDILRLVEDG